MIRIKYRLFPVCWTVLALYLSVTGVASAQPADTAVSEFVRGLEALVEDRFQDAEESFVKTIQIDDEQSDAHLALAVARIAQGKSQVDASLTRARRLDSRNQEIKLWQFAADALFKPPGTNPNPPYDVRSPYTRALIDAIHRASTQSDPQRKLRSLTQIPALSRAFARQQMIKPFAWPHLLQRAIDLYNQKKYDASWNLIEAIRAGNPNHVKLLYISASCRLYHKNYALARKEYSRVLELQPNHSYALLGRARAAALMGDADRAQRDFAAAEAIDPKSASAFRENIFSIIERKKTTNVIAANPGDALAQLKSSIRSGKTLPKLIDLAIPLVQARRAKNWNREEVYADRVAELKRSISASPNNPDPLVALAQFYLRPLATRQVMDQKGNPKKVLLPLRDEWRESGGKTVYAVPWVFRGDPGLAIPLLKRALQINANHHGALRAYALALRMKHDLDRMQPYVKRALAIQAVDLDMARLYLDYYTSGARVLNDLAAQLRQPSVRYEDRSDGRYKITTHPSPSQLAQADQLDRQAQDYRRQAPVALKRVAGATKGNASQKITHDLANAVYYHWLGDLGQSGGAIKSALKVDPYNFDAIEMMIDLATGTHTYELRDRWQGWLASLMGTSARVQLRPVFKLVKETRYRSALKQLDEAEKVDPGASLIPAYRAVAFAGLNDTQGVIVASQLTLALEGAKAKVAGRSLLPNAKGELNSGDAGLSIQMRFFAARALRDTDLANAIAVSESALLLAQRVPVKDWDTVVDTTDMPGTRKGGRSVRGLLIDHHRLLSQLYSAQGNRKQSSRHSQLANKQQQTQQRIRQQQQREAFTNRKPL